MDKITDEMVLAKLREIVAERPEYKYVPPAGHDSECLYVHTDDNGDSKAPGCLVGHVLAKLGVPLNDMAKHEGKGANGLCETLDLGLSSYTRSLLDNVQERQDNGCTWGEALSAAEKYAAGE